VTPAARIAAAIELLAEIDAAPRRPADAAANNFFRTRRFIGAGDRRAVSDRAWGVLRARRRLDWWLAGGDAPPRLPRHRSPVADPQVGGAPVPGSHMPDPHVADSHVSESHVHTAPGSRMADSATPRTLVAAALLFDGWSQSGLTQAFSGGQFAAAPLSPAEQATLAPLVGHTLDHPAMPDAVRLEVPDWVLPRLATRFGAALGAELGALLDPAPLDMRANLLKATREVAQAALAAEGFAATPTPHSPWGLRLPGRRPITAGAAFQSGLVEIQDEGSQLVALLTDARPGMRVADLCAGAGGKSLALAVTMGNRGHIAACDVSSPRLDAAVRRFRRAGAHNIERHLLGPGDKWLKRHAGDFDRVLVDAPCTGTGTWRRNPDARGRLTETDLAELLVRQAALLDDAAPLVRKGGRLVYATCSLFPEENEGQVAAFLARHAAFALLPLARAWPRLVSPQGAAHGGPSHDGASPQRPYAEASQDAPSITEPSGVALSGMGPPCGGEVLALTPRQHGTDGFFAAVLERVA
jgi:16S rRNA (cytosine967-C5)-methyltransferase